MTKSPTILPCRPPLVGLDGQAPQPSRSPRPERDHEAAHQETVRPQPQRRRPREPELDGDGIGAPEQRHGEGQDGAPEIDRAIVQIQTVTILEDPAGASRSSAPRHGAVA